MHTLRCVHHGERSGWWGSTCPGQSKVVRSLTHDPRLHQFPEPRPKTFIPDFQHSDIFAHFTSLLLPQEFFPLLIFVLRHSFIVHLRMLSQSFDHSSLFFSREGGRDFPPLVKLFRLRLSVRLNGLCHLSLTLIKLVDNSRLDLDMIFSFRWTCFCLLGYPLGFPGWHYVIVLRPGQSEHWRC